jgi:integrase/recombinase XerC
MTSKNSTAGSGIAQLSAARRAAAIRLRVDLGLSSGSIARLNIEDLDRQGRRLWIRRRGRLGKESRLIAEPTLVALEVWLEVRGTIAPADETALFVMVSGRSRGQRMSGYNVLQVGPEASSS